MQTRYNPQGKVVLITGAAHRVGAAIARHLHGLGMNVIVHYRNSRAAAEGLQYELESLRPNSIYLIEGEIVRHGDFNG